MKRKLKCNRGETLVEVLAAILIGALSVALLFTAVAASVRMGRIARETDSRNKQVLADAEMQTDTSAVTGKTVTVTKAGDSSGEEVSVTFYGGDGALSYVLNTTP